MSRSQRQSDPGKELTRLEKRHKRLKEQVALFDAQLTLTAHEKLEVQRLKKKKLATKDAIHRMTQL